jgi:hypothetical protein
MSLDSFNILHLIRVTQQNTRVIGYLTYFTFDTLLSSLWNVSYVQQLLFCISPQIPQPLTGSVMANLKCCTSKFDMPWYLVCLSWIEFKEPRKLGNRVHYIFMYKRLERNSLTIASKCVFQKSGVDISANVLRLHNSGNVRYGF